MRKLPLALVPCAGLLIVAVMKGMPGEQQHPSDQSKPVFTPATLLTIDFDPDQGFSIGAQSSTFLASFGIPSVTFGGAEGAGAPTIMNSSADPNNIVPSPPNVLQQSASSLDPDKIHRLTFTFSPMLTAFSLTRMGATSHSTDTWRAHFFDAAHVEIGSFGEANPINDEPPKTFTFNAPAGELIASMDLASVWTAFATYRNIPVDDFKLTQASSVSEPAIQSLLGIGLAGLGQVSKSSLAAGFYRFSAPLCYLDRAVSEQLFVLLASLPLTAAAPDHADLGRRLRTDLCGLGQLAADARHARAYDRVR
jgi:hypothetical protein